MKTRITALDLGRIAPIFTGISGIRYLIEYKPHWWSRWRIIAFDCDSTCDADVFNEGFIAGAHYVLDRLCLLSSTHAVEKELAEYVLAEYTEEKNRQPCHKTYYSGFLPNKFSCPFKDKCRRYLEAVIGDPLWWTEAAFDGKQCRNFINKND